MRGQMLEGIAQNKCVAVVDIVRAEDERERLLIVLDVGEHLKQISAATKLVEVPAPKLGPFAELVPVPLS